MDFNPPLKCRRKTCPTLIESGRSDKEYCCSACESKDRYERNAAYEKRLNAIRSQIRKMDKILEHQYCLHESNPISSDVLKKEGFQDNGYCQQIYHRESKLWLRLLVDYAFNFNKVADTIQIFKEHDLRHD